MSEETLGNGEVRWQNILIHLLKRKNVKVEMKPFLHSAMELDWNNTYLGFREVWWAGEERDQISSQELLSCSHTYCDLSPHQKLYTIAEYQG